MLNQITYYALAAFLALFPIANPIGAVPIFISLTEKDTKSHRQKQAKRTAIYVFIVWAVFLLTGKPILQFFGISIDVLKIAGGAIITYVGWNLVNVNPWLTESETNYATHKQQDISFTPMAIPMISGPGSISYVIAISEKLKEPTAFLGSILGIAALSVIVWLFLRSSEQLNKFLGESGIGAAKRVFGFFILAIAIQLIVDGIRGIVG